VLREGKITEPRVVLMEGRRVGWRPGGAEVSDRSQDSGTAQGPPAVKGGHVLWCGRGGKDGGRVAWLAGRWGW